MKKYFFTSESVTEGHPDKLADLISDSILDECLKQDKKSRVAVETIALGVDLDGDGDQGIMFGYASNETENYMPYAIYMAHKLAKRLTEARKEGIISYIFNIYKYTWKRNKNRR